jgi:hypothetical protein
MTFPKYSRITQIAMADTRIISIIRRWRLKRWIYRPDFMVANLQTGTIQTQLFAETKRSQTGDKRVTAGI